MLWQDYPLWFFVGLVLFLAGSSGLQVVSTISFWLVCFFIVCLLYARLIKSGLVIFKKNRLISGAVVGFFILSTISTLLSEDVLLSVRFLIFSGVCLGAALVGNFYRDQLTEKVPAFLITSGIFLCIYSVLLAVFKPALLLPDHGYQLVFSRFGSHNHLGDFLVLPMLVCLYSVVRKYRWKHLLLSIFFLPFLLFSYSRSAYLSFFLVGAIFVIVNFFKSKKKILHLVPVIFFIPLGLVVLLFFMSSVFESKYVALFRPVHQLLVDNFGLKFKHFGANRLEYANTAVSSISEKPWFGIGPGNFVEASAKYSSIPNYRTHSSHNIFLDVFVEYGLFAFICLLIVVYVAVKISFKNPTVLSLLFFALLINFQTDYTFRIFSVVLLLFLIIGMIYGRDRTHLVNPKA